ncbi:MAG: diguanylate cyclase [Planctomycetes bacterium]|nr:diguanylate cyclase [Planctomycetota bacterium]
MSEKLLNILIVDDDAVDQMRLKRVLEKLLSQEMEFTVESAETLAQALDLLKTGSFNLVLLDLRLPDSVGLETVDSVHHACPDMPIVVLTGSDDGKLGVETVKRGAIDYISKSFEQSVFETRVGIALHIVKLQEKLQLLANIDELTGLANYRHFFDILEHEISRAKVTGDALAIIMFDIDHFKSVNDSYGHLGGDGILKQMGQILQENIYPLDVTARYGGDEFIVLMPGTSSTEALQAAERLRGIIDRFEWKVSDQRISITASAGLANIDSNNLIDSHDLVEKADMALYAAKRRGRNCVVNVR